MRKRNLRRLRKDYERRLDEANRTAELERYCAVERERRRWEDRESPMMQLLESVGVVLAGKGTGGGGDKEFGRVGTVVAKLEQQLEATRFELQRSQEEVKRLLQDKEEAA